MAEKIFDVPLWAEMYMREWLTKLNLNHWQVTLLVDRCPGGDVNTLANVHIQPDINTAVITLRVDLEINDDWHVAIIHEVLHIAHGRIDNFLERIVFPDTGAYSETSLKKAYLQYMESYIEGLAVSLYKSQTDRTIGIPFS